LKKEYGMRCSEEKLIAYCCDEKELENVIPSQNINGFMKIRKKQKIIPSLTCFFKDVS